MTSTPNSPAQPPVSLPATWSDWGLSEEQYVELMNFALPVLARSGIELGEPVLQDLAKAARIEPTARILQDPRQLYEEALRFSFRQLWPSEQQLEDTSDLDDAIPADALRALVIGTYRRYRAHPDAVRLIITENLFSIADVAQRPGVLEESPVALQMDRVLMRGHDVGAFRERVSAEDLYIVILSLSVFPMASGSTFHSLYGMNATDEVNTAGLEALVADTVLAFVTTNMPTSQGSSYTHSSLSPSVGSSVAARLYSRESLPSSVGRHRASFLSSSSSTSSTTTPQATSQNSSPDPAGSAAEGDVATEDLVDLDDHPYED